MKRQYTSQILQHLPLVLLGIVFAVCTTRAGDWPQFRGPHRDGAWEESGILESFPADGLKSRWRQPVGGGFASPVVADGKVFVFDVALLKPTAQERLHCFEEKTGKVLWVYAYDEPYGEWSYDPERGAGPTATPIVEGDSVYIVGANGSTHCLDAKLGRVIWEKNIGREYQIAEMSCRPSPLIDGNLLIVFTGAKPGASLLALDKHTGKEIWKALNENVSNSSPIIIPANAKTGGPAKRQLIAWSNSSLASLDPTNGKLFWREPMATSGNDSAATPVFQGTRLLVSGLMVDLSTDSPNIIWPEIRSPSKRVLSNTSTPLLQGDYIYTAKGYGELVCLEAATGQQIWSTNTVTASKNGASIHITPLAGKKDNDGKQIPVILFTDEGNLILAQLSPKSYRETSRAHLIDPTWPFAQAKFVYAPPAFSNRHIFARNEGEVVCASLEAGN